MKGEIPKGKRVLTEKNKVLEGRKKRRGRWKYILEKHLIVEFQQSKNVKQNFFISFFNICSRRIWKKF